MIESWEKIVIIVFTAVLTIWFGRKILTALTTGYLSLQPFGEARRAEESGAFWFYFAFVFLMFAGSTAIFGLTALTWIKEAVG